MIYYIRDNENNVIGFIYNGETYYYKKNIQQDVIGIYDNTFNQIVTYTYDSWGNIISIVDTSTNNIGTINPYRYRSYYYDEETELYYLNTRYYNPKWKRFINIDDYVSTGLEITCTSMYLYCGNNPISRQDSNGRFFGEIVDFFNTAYQETVEVVKSIMPVLAPAGAGLSAADGPLPFGDALAIGGGVAVIGAAASYGIYKAIDSTRTKSKSKTKAKTRKKELSDDTIIYRWGTFKPEHLILREKDYLTNTGLSFSIIPSNGQHNMYTTVGKIRSTNLFDIDFNYTTGHVGIFPKNRKFNYKKWYLGGENTIWTQTLLQIVRTWN